MCGIYYTMFDQKIHAKNNKSTINLNIVQKNYETAILKALDQGKLNAEEIYRMNIILYTAIPLYVSGYQLASLVANSICTGVGVYLWVTITGEFYKLYDKLYELFKDESKFNSHHWKEL